MWSNLCCPPWAAAVKGEHDPLSSVPPGAPAWSCIVQLVTQAADMNSAHGIMSNL